MLRVQTISSQRPLIFVSLRVVGDGKATGILQIHDRSICRCEQAKCETAVRSRGPVSNATVAQFPSASVKRRSDLPPYRHAMLTPLALRFSVARRRSAERQAEVVRAVPVGPGVAGHARSWPDPHGCNPARMLVQVRTSQRESPYDPQSRVRIFGAQRAAEGPRRRCGERKAETAAGGGPTGVETNKPLEDLLKHRFRNAQAVIGDAQMRRVR